MPDDQASVAFTDSHSHTVNDQWHSLIQSQSFNSFSNDFHFISYLVLLRVNSTIHFCIIDSESVGESLTDSVNSVSIVCISLSK